MAERVVRDLVREALAVGRREPALRLQAGPRLGSDALAQGLGLDLGDKQLLDRYQRWRSLDALSVAPENALFVGDRLYEDVRGAGELGMTTVQALW